MKHKVGRIPQTPMCLALAFLGLAAGPAFSAPPKGDLDRLQGTWVVVSDIWEGAPVPNSWRLSRITFLGGKAIYQTEKYLQEVEPRLVPGGNHKGIELTLGKSGLNTRFGIYRLEGDRLTICWGRKEKPPTRFVSKKGMHIHLTEFKRTRALQGAEGRMTKWEKKARARLRAGGNLLQLAWAMYGYAEDKGWFLPPPAILDEKGKPLLSWRVALLPYLGYGELYKQFRLGEPWDSFHNKKLLAKMPPVYAPLGEAPKQPYSTYYQVFVGKGSIFEQGRSFSLHQDFPKGTVYAILIAEAGEPVPWTKPADLPFDPKKPLPKLGGMLGDGLISFVTADAALHSPNNQISKKTLRAAVTRSRARSIDEIPSDLDK